MLPVTQPFLPPLAEYTAYLTQVWSTGQLTNSGPLVRQLERQLELFLNGLSVELTTNGTVALQLAIRALDLTGEIITTPFSYVATTNAILWEKCTPVFVDIERSTYCLDAAKIEAAITPRTQAILATHVYGFPCNVVQIEAIAHKYKLRVIYDGAHAFGTCVAGRSLLSYGDVTACSFHATKIFHMAEGGAVVTPHPELARKISLLKTNGHVGSQHMLAGTNAKTSELNAALGLCLLPRIPAFIQERAVLYQVYRSELADLPLGYPELTDEVAYNYAYFPIIFPTQALMLHSMRQLAEEGVGTRRYFSPTLNALPYHVGEPCPVAEDISQRVLCLPFYQDLTVAQVIEVARLLRTSIRAYCATNVLLQVDE